MKGYPGGELDEVFDNTLTQFDGCPSPNQESLSINRKARPHFRRLPSARRQSPQIAYPQRAVCDVRTIRFA